MALTSRVTYGLLGSVDTSTLSGSFVPIGIPFQYPTGIVKLVNNSNMLLTVSIDGQTPVDVLPPNSFFLYDITSNLPNGLQGAYFPQGTQFYVNGNAGTGSVYITSLFIVPTAAIPSLIA